jgi:hypothetical protein
MPHSRFAARVMAWLGLAAALAIPLPGRAAPKPLPDLSPEEIQLRALVEPLRDGVTEGETLQPLHAWLDAREAAGKGRDAERELRRVLKRITDDQNKDLLRAAEWVRVLQIQRSKLYQELSDDTIYLRRAIEKSQKFAPVPVEVELLPGRAELSDAFLGGDVGTLPQDATADGESDEVAPETENSESTDLDAAGLLNRLTLDLTALQHLLHECDNEYEHERSRHRAALDALTKVLLARKAAARRTPS